MSRKQARKPTRAERKLSSSRGESLAEVMVATLIVAFSTVMLVTMIGSANSFTKQSRTIMAEYYNEINALADLSDGSAGVGVGNLSFEDTSPFSSVHVRLTTAMPGETVLINYKETPGTGVNHGTTIVAYKKK